MLYQTEGTERYAVMQEMSMASQRKMIACQLLKRAEVGRDYKMSVELNMTYSQFCTVWNANEFLDTLMRPADDGPDENISYQGIILC